MNFDLKLRVCNKTRSSYSQILTDRGKPTNLNERQLYIYTPPYVHVCTVHVHHADIQSEGYL